VIGRDPLFLETVRQALSCAGGDIPILLQGETGSGKDHLARYIHESSSRSEQPLVTVNCAAIPQELAESELFGYQKGAFTNAVECKTGLIEAADGGTLFLNEIAELSPAIQAKLLAALDEKKFFKLGSTDEKQADFRLIAASNIDLAEAVASGKFRADLYYRLAAISLEIPPLVQRGDDAYMLFEYFLSCQEISLAGVNKHLLRALRQRMRDYAWGGNVREVKNYAELFAVTETRDADSICRRLLDRLDKAVEPIDQAAGVVNLNQQVEHFERSRIRKALTASGGVIRRAARTLGVPEATLRSKMKKLQINAA
jgi:transcriptional regulator with PAS, ATPase and Fis domain